MKNACCFFSNFETKPCVFVCSNTCIRTQVRATWQRMLAQRLEQSKWVHKVETYDYFSSLSLFTHTTSTTTTTNILDMEIPWVKLLQSFALSQNL